MAGGLGVLGDCYKMQIYALAKYINRDKKWFPKYFSETAFCGTAANRAKDSDSLPDYAILDRFFTSI